MQVDIQLADGTASGGITTRTLTKARPPRRRSPRPEPRGAGPATAGHAGPSALLRHFTVRNGVGLLLGPAAKLARLAGGFESEIMFRYKDRETDACSLLGLVILQAGPGARVAVKATGRDARAAMDAVAKVFETDFRETGNAEVRMAAPGPKSYMESAQR